MAVTNYLLGDESDIIHQRQLQVLLLINMLAALGIAFVSPILDSLVGPFNTTSANIGLMLSFFTFPQFFMIPFAGIISDKIGRKPLLLTGLFLFGTGGVLIATQTNFTVVLGLRALQGIGAACIAPVITASLGDLYSGSKDATAQGLRLTSSGLSSTIFPILAGSLIVLAWQYPFYIHAIAYPAMILCYVFFEEPARSETDATHSRNVTGQSVVAEVIEEMKRPPVVATLFAYCTATFLYLAFFSYISILVVELIDSTSGQVGLIVGLYSLTYGVSGSQAGRLTVRTNGLIQPLVGANISMAVGFTLIGVLPSIYTVIVGCVIFGLGAGITASLYRSLLITFSSDTNRGSLVSIMESSGRLAQTASPIFFGLSVSALTPILGYRYSLQAVWISLGLATTGIALICLFVVYSHRKS